MTRVSRQLRLLTVLGVLVLGPAVLRADPPDTPTPAPTTPPAAPPGTMAPTMPAATPAVQQERPLFYLRDQRGDLVWVPEFSFEEWDRLVRIAEGLADPAPPPVTLTRVSATGRVEDGQARLDVRVDLRVQSDLKQAVAVPLDFRSAILADQQVQYEGPGSQFLHYSSDHGYVCWLKAEAETTHTLRFQIIRPISELSGQQRLRVDFPDARSTLTLEVPLEAPEVSISPRDRATYTVDPSDSGSGSRITVDGVGGTQELQWRANVEEVADNDPLISSVASITVNVEGQQYITSEATLDVRTFRGEIQSFDVELPRGMKLISRQESGYRVESLPMDGTSQRRRIRVTFDRKSERPAKVYLLAELSREADTANGPIDAAGFRVVGASHQRGDVTVLVHGEWAIRPVEMSNMRRITSDLSTAANQSVRASRFLFFQQPCTLELAVLSRESRINVEPTYAIHVMEGQVRLTARLVCQVRGEKAFGLDIDMAEWQVDKVSPTNLVQDTIDLQQSKPLTIPFSELAQIAKGEFLLEIKAHRNLDPDESLLSLLLPKPQTGVVAKSTVVNTTPATVYVSAADNVQLTPEPSKIEGLLKDALAEDIDRSLVPELMQAPLAFRANAEESRFVAAYAIQPGSVTVGVDARVQIGEQRATCRQWLRYRIAYEALNQITLECPRGPVENNTMDITLGTDVLPYTMLETPTESTDLSSLTPDRVLVQVNLLRDRIGPCEIELSFDQPVGLPGESRAPQTFPLGLVVPAKSSQTIVTSTTLQLQAADGLQASLPSDPWTLTPASRVEGSVQQYTAKGVARTAAVEVAVTDQPATANLLHRSFIHSWWTPQGRRDRASFLVTPFDQRAVIQTPDGVVELKEQVLVAINGHRGFHELSDEGRLVVELPESTLGRETVIEVWYTLPSELSVVRPETFAFPRMEGTHRPEGFFWQITVPSNRVLVSAPELTSSYRWTWSNGWGRQPTMSLSELEEWVRGGERTASTARTAATPSTLAQGRRYLFSSFDQPSEVTVRFASRQLLVAIGAGAAFLVGLLLIYLPFLRHPVLLLVGGVALCLAGSFAPELALLLLPIAAFGIAMVVLALLIQRLLPPPVRSRNVVPSTAETPRDVESKAQRRESPSHATTATVPVGSPLQAAEPKP